MKLSIEIVDPTAEVLAFLAALPAAPAGDELGAMSERQERQPADVEPRAKSERQEREPADVVVRARNNDSTTLDGIINNVRGAVIEAIVEGDDGRDRVRAALALVGATKVSEIPRDLDAHRAVLDALGGLT